MKRMGTNGFTIMEIVVGLGVLSITVISLTTLMININSLNDRARDFVLANALAENKMEELRSAGFLTLENGTYDFTIELPDTITGPSTASYVISDQTESVKRVDMTILYREAGQNRTLTYTGFVGELGVGQ